MKRPATDRPQAGKVYSLTGPGPSIARGNTWGDSETPICPQCPSNASLYLGHLGSVPHYRCCACGWTFALITA